jgi:hypothetical protein
MRIKAFSDESNSSEDGKANADASQDPEYTFTGFDVDFSEKIMLIPPASPADSPEKGAVPR